MLAFQPLQKAFMPREIEDSSPAAKEIVDGGHLFKPKYDFPYHLLTVGKSFRVEFNEVSSFQVLRVTTDRYGKKLNKKFKCIKHSDVYEVACIAEVAIETLVVEPSSFESRRIDIDPALSIQEAAKQFYAPGYEPPQTNKPYVDPDDVSGSTWTPPKPNGW